MPDIEKKEDFGKGGRDKTRYWQAELKRSEKAHDAWKRRTDAIVKLYRDDSDTESGNGTRFNILWSNTETLRPVLFGKLPDPDVSRTFMDRDPVAKNASEIIERCLKFSAQSYDMTRTIKRSVEDNLLGGRGIAKVVYTPIYGDVQPKLPVEPIVGIDEFGQPTSTLPEGAQTDENGMAYILGEPEEQVVYEEVKCVHWRRDEFLCDPDAKSWDEVTWVAFSSLYTRDELIAEFGDVGHKVKLTHKSKDLIENSSESTIARAVVWEIWDKNDKTRVFFSPGYMDDLLDQAEDPYKLQNFFPMPEPLFGVMTNDSLIPIPEYTLYQDLANELEKITSRKTKLIDQIKVRGIYNSVQEHLKNIILDCDDGELLPVDNLNPDLPLESQIQWMPIEQYAKVLTTLDQQRESLLSQIYDITGISDIIRGSTKASETAKAQSIKASFASLRLSDRQDKVATFIRDIYRIKAELMAEQFEPKTLSMISGREVTPEIISLIQENEPRIFRITVETEETITPDREKDKQMTTEFVGALAQFTEIAPVLVQTLGHKFVKELLMVIFRKFKIGRNLEDLLEEEAEKIINQPQQQQPSPEQIEAESEQKKQQAESQMKVQEMSFQAQENQKDREADLIAKALIGQQSNLRGEY